MAKKDESKGAVSGMDFPDSQSRLLKSIASRVGELSHLGPEIIGSLCKRSGKCANPDCPCHHGEAMHFSWQLTSTSKGKTRTVYVPVEAVEKVSEWSGNHKRGQKLRKEISALCERYIRSVVPRKRAGTARRKALEKDDVEADK